ncbi:MAG TPA: isoprenylcysteine carboxylmethyltransferase family protein [Anaerolineae bacterium]|nr:isoprenylcysteine carboxylmethyltransferase family protein [Anaerolineae bacterium]
MKHKVLENLGLIVNGLSIAVFIFLGNLIEVSLRWPYFKYIGWILLGIGLFLIAVSTYTLISNRGKGLIDWGIYGIVRHPMYVGAMLAFLSWVFFLPHWLTLLIASINIVIVYLFILQGERRNLELFGSDYESYIENVPRVNFIAGFLKSLLRR